MILRETWALFPVDVVVSFSAAHVVFGGGTVSVYWPGRVPGRKTFSALWYSITTPLGLGAGVGQDFAEGSKLGKQLK